MTHLNDLLNRCVGLLQDRDDVLAALGRLVGDASLNQGASLVRGDLAGDEDLRAGDDGLGLGRVSRLLDGMVAGLREGAGRVQEEGRSLGRSCFPSKRSCRLFSRSFLHRSQAPMSCLVSTVIVWGRARRRWGFMREGILVAATRSLGYARKVRQLPFVSNRSQTNSPQYSPGQASLVVTILIPDMFREIN